MGKAERSPLFEALGGETGCLRISCAFYSRVSENAALRSLFPGKSLRCATEELAAFLVQFFEGDEDRTQYRWWFGLSASHARFQISDSQRVAWLEEMRVTLAEELEPEIAKQMNGLFGQVSRYLVFGEEVRLLDSELRAKWDQQVLLDNFKAALDGGDDAEAIRTACLLTVPPGVYVGVLGAMLETGRQRLCEFAEDEVDRVPGVGSARFNRRPLLHLAAGAGALGVTQRLLALGINPDLEDDGGHTALFRAAGGPIATAAGVVRALVAAGADPKRASSLTGSTPLHAAARHGNLPAAQALVQLGALVTARDKRGLTPIDRALRCRKATVAKLLIELSGSDHS